MSFLRLTRVFLSVHSLVYAFVFLLLRALTFSLYFFPPHLSIRFQALIFVYFALIEGKGLAFAKQQISDELFQVSLPD